MALATKLTEPESPTHGLPASVSKVAAKSGHIETSLARLETLLRSLPATSQRRSHSDDATPNMTTNNVLISCPFQSNGSRGSLDNTDQTTVLYHNSAIIATKLSYLCLRLVRILKSQ